MSGMNVIGAAIFDLDGTVLDSSGVWDGLAERFLRGRGISPEQGLSDLLGSMTMQEGCRYLKAAYSLPDSPEQIQQSLLAIIEGFYRNECRLKPGAAQLLAELRGLGIPFAAATAGDKALSAAALERLGILDMFAGILTCDEYGGKDRPEIFLAAAGLLGAVPEETAVFEDSFHAVMSAKSAGFVTAAVKDCSEPRQEQLRAAADYYKEDLSGYIGSFGRWIR